MLILNKFKITLSILLALAIMNTSISINTSPTFFSFISLLLLFTIPGIILLFLLRVRNISIWIYAILSISLSIAFIMLSGVLFNWVWLETIGSPPLVKTTILTFYNLILIILIFTAYFIDSEYSFTIRFKKIPVKQALLFIIPPIICLLSIMGAITLNNNGPNYLTMIMLGSIAIFSVILLIFQNKIDRNIYPYAVFFFSLSLLFMLSLRSWYLSGWDIQDEHRVYLLTKGGGFWAPNLTEHDYNACLSITLLPTIISNLTHFSIEFIFKVIYQLFFAIVPLSVFFISKRYITSLASYFASFYMIMQPFFGQSMVALMRQEMAFLFFTTMILILFENKLGRKTREFIVITFGFSMIVSHYSTTYLALILLLSTFILISFYRLLRRNKILKYIAKKIHFKNLSYGEHKYFITPAMLLLLFSFALFWFSIVNDNAMHLDQVYNNTIKDVKHMFRNEANNEEAKKAIEILPKNKTNPQDELNTYLNYKIAEYSYDLNQKYSEESYKNFFIQPSFTFYTTPLLIQPINDSINIFFQILKQLSKFFVLFGAVLIFIVKFKKTDHHREYIILASFSAILIAIMLIHPSLSNQYNLSRFYLQTLVFLSLPAVIGGIFFFTLLKKYAIHATGISFILLYIFYSGFLNQVIGGEKLTQLENKGIDYDKFYVHKEEIIAGEWLNIYKGEGRVFADNNAHLRLRYTSWLDADHTILPQIIYKKSYVYSNYNNTVNNKTFAYFQGDVLGYIFPHTFLEENKDVIYNNGGSKIYR